MKIYKCPVCKRTTKQAEGVEVYCNRPNWVPKHMMERMK